MRSDPVNKISVEAAVAERAGPEERVSRYGALLTKAGLEPARTVDDMIGLMIRFGLLPLPASTSD